jgi:hypothetical protein
MYNEQAPSHYYYSKLFNSLIDFQDVSFDFFQFLPIYLNPILIIYN